MIGQFLSWYLVIQVIALATLPLSLRLFVNLPDRGYAAAKILGIVLVSLLLWLGYSYGLLRQDAGTAWLMVLAVAAVSGAVGRADLRTAWQTRRLPVGLGYVLFVELLFLVGFVAWAVVRAYDPAANHTEQPMDLMFMNSIWVSESYPPRDAWLAGYPISYYYLGYWLLTVLGKLSGNLPEIAYNVGQASWYGLLLIGSFGLVYNLLATRGGDDDASRVTLRSARLGGLLAALLVAVAGNLQAVVEWLYANGINLARLIAWADVANFPENAAVTNKWYIGVDWWWWRTSRVLEDLDLLGNHIEVIDEFPAFSYVLGDNHPHVMAMPVVLLAITLVLNLFLQGYRTVSHEAEHAPWWQNWRDLAPLGFFGLGLTGVTLGALVFLNTWDFPPYWLLFVLVVLFAAVRQAVAAGRSIGATWRIALLTAVGLGGATVALIFLVYLPYFLTAQSQAGGFLPNLFYPTRLPQFLLMFGTFLPAVIALVLIGWSSLRPSALRLGLALLMVLGLPALFLTVTLAASRGARGAALLARVALPPGGESHTAFAIARWTAQPWTLLLTGVLLALVVALLWERLTAAVRGAQPDPGATFALLLSGVGLLLVYAPEFIYLRDNFGTRMNTVFKFYYQAWLLFALAGAYGIVRGLRGAGVGRGARRWTVAGLAGLSLLLGSASLIFMPAGAYSKTAGFRSETPTFNALAYVETQSPGELAAVAWIRTMTAPDALILEAKGASYRADFSRMSAATGRPTLLGWDGHESQWRGKAYGTMAEGRPELLQLVYGGGAATEIAAALSTWGVDYVFVGPSERTQYGMRADGEAQLAAATDLVFDQNDVRIYRRRGPDRAAHQTE